MFAPALFQMFVKLIFRTLTSSSWIGGSCALHASTGRTSLSGRMRAASWLRTDMLPTGSSSCGSTESWQSVTVGLSPHVVLQRSGQNFQIHTGGLYWIYSWKISVRTWKSWPDLCGTTSHHVRRILYVSVWKLLWSLVERISSLFYFFHGLIKD